MAQQQMNNLSQVDAMQDIALCTFTACISCKLHRHFQCKMPEIIMQAAQTGLGPKPKQAIADACSSQKVSMSA